MIIPLNKFKFEDQSYRFAPGLRRMALNGLRLEHSLEGNSNYVAWKYRMEAVLEDNQLNE